MSPGHLVRSAAAAFALLATLLVASHSAAAAQQESDATFTIIAGFGEGFAREDVMAVRNRQQTITATVRGAECATADLRVEEDIRLVIGSEGQPVPCSEEGAEVILYNVYGNEMDERFVVRVGTVALLTNYAVAPLSDPAPAAAGMGGARDASSRPATVGSVAWLALAAVVVVGGRRFGRRGV